jgi:hypothetical protein
MHPSWYGCFKAFLGGSKIGLGGYKKVKDMVVNDGVLESYTPWQLGTDSRWKSGEGGPINVGGGSMFGCSLVGPVDAFLSVNGFEECADAMTGEDYITGKMLENRGWKFSYDRAMLTFESEEHHHSEMKFATISKPYPGFQDANWFIANDVNSGRRRWAEHGYDLRALRDRILNGGSFPTEHPITTHWPDGQPLCQL